MKPVIKRGDLVLWLLGALVGSVWGVVFELGRLGLWSYLRRLSVGGRVVPVGDSYSELKRQRDITTVRAVEAYAEHNNTDIRRACDAVHVGKTAYYNAKKRLKDAADTDGQKADKGRTQPDTV